MPQYITSSARRSTPGGVPYTLASGYPKVQINANGEATASEVYLIDPRNFDALVADLMPIQTIINGNIQFIPRYYMPGTDFLVMESISAEPQSSEMPADPFEADDEAPANSYDTILAVTIAYKTGPQSQQDQDQQQPETFLERSRTQTVEMLTIQPDGKTKFAGEAAKNPITPIVQVIPVVYWQMDWKRVSAPNFAVIDSLNGCVNRAAYSWLENSPAETVLFLGASAKQEYQYIGNRTIVKPWSIGLKFATKVIREVDSVGNVFTYGWNHVYNPTKHRFQRLTRTTDGAGEQPLYTLVDFMQIFAPAT